MSKTAIASILAGLAAIAYFGWMLYTARRDKWKPDPNAPPHVPPPRKNPQAEQVEP